MSASRVASAARLAEIVGSAHAIEDPAQLGAYAIEGAAPEAAVRPETSEEIAAIVKFAQAEKLALVPCGARTKLAMGLAPRRYDVALDLTRMDRIVAFDPGDLTLSVEAGIPFCKVQSALAEHGQFLPLAPPYARQTTIGGTIACGVDGPLRQLYGTAREFILGMEFVTGEGVAAKSGGCVVKNVTGYDLHKLMVGALGTLGAITKVNFRTFPALREPRAFLASFESAKQAMELRQRIAESSLRPVGVNAFSPETATLFSRAAATRIEPRPMPQNAFRPGCWTLGVGFAGNEAALARYEASLGSMAKQCGAAGSSVLSGGDLQAVFALEREWIPLALEASPATVIGKIGVLPARVADALGAAAKAAEAQRLRWAAIARGVGVIYFAALPQSVAEDDGRRAVLVANEIRAACSSLGGHATIPWCPAEWKASLGVWGVEPAAAAQMRKLKGVFDPNGVFSPGRFAAGI